MVRIFRFVDAISEWTGKLISPVVPVLGAIIIGELVVRGLGHPTVWANQMCSFLFGGYCVLAGAYALRYRRHVNVDILTSRLSLKKLSILNLFTWVFFFAFCIVILWHGSELAWESFVIREHLASVWGPPMYPYKAVLPLAAFLIILQGVVEFIRDVIGATTGERPA